MNKRLKEKQIIGFLCEAEMGLLVAELCRRHGFAEATCNLWRNKFGGMRSRTPNGSRGSYGPKRSRIGAANVLFRSSPFRFCPALPIGPAYVRKNQSLFSADLQFV